MSSTDLLGRAYAATGSSVRAFSPRYAAPEQFDPRMSATGPWTDVYAMALVFVEVAAGVSAYEGVDATQFLAQAMDRARRPTLETLGAPSAREVEAVLQRALAVDSRNRFPSMSE